MPVFLNDGQSAQDRSSRCITIGLINNMPDEALKATERQYLSLLDSASEGMLIRLSYYVLPGVPRREAARRHIRSSYSNFEDLWESHLDGLIVTGREPLTENLEDEPYWGNLTGLAVWANDNTHASVWSCLAAHAAILHMDGIGRVRRDSKLCGIFECARVAAHPMMAAAPARFRLPHSRWNGVPEETLASCGYRVLTRTENAEVDMFIKQQKKLYVFFQGHPEYQSDTLLREYRRDIGRYFKSDTDMYPSVPRHYFDRDTTAVLTRLQERALCDRGDALMLETKAALGKSEIENTWSDGATAIYKNWLKHICAQKEKTLRSKSFRNPPQTS